MKEAFDNTKFIMDRLIAESGSGLQGYADAILAWMDEKKNVDSNEKREILQKLFEKTHAAIIYGAAGTGKTYLIRVGITPGIYECLELFFAKPHF